MSKTISDRVQGFGVLLALFGLVSSVLTFFGYELRILMWIDLWGSLVAWGIRLALIVGGVGLFFVASLFDDSNAPEGQADAATQHAAREAWAALKNHPRMQEALQYASQHVRIAWEPVIGDSDVYVVRRVLWQDAQYRWTVDGGNQMYTPEDPRVTNVAIYIERANAPQRAVCTVDFATRSAVAQEAHPGTWMTFVGG